MTVALAGVLAVGCNDLDTEPLGSVVTEEQKAAVMEIDPSASENAASSLQAATHIPQQFYSAQHRDFGLSSIMLGNDSRSLDVIGPDDGYNWYSADASWADWGGTYYANLIFWQYNYTMIQTANTIAAPISVDTDNHQLQYNLAQALASRGYSYYMLANMYQFTYAIAADQPCVPIITPENMVEAGMNGNPRATVAQVWDRIIDDFKTAAELLDKAQQGGITRKGDKRFVNQAVCYGMLARAYLTTLQYSEAVTAAQTAIQLATAEGLAPISIAEARVPGFYTISAKNYIWGIENPASSGYTQGVTNFASMMGSWMTNGYNSVGCARRINKKLYAQIPASDARKNWWLDGNANIPATLPSTYAAYINSCKGSGGEFKPYTQVKFGAASNTPGTTNGATDQPIMRVEELYLILAEAQGMTAPATGAATLESFVKTYRDPNYTCTASSTQAFQDEIWIQRRIELWGEGFAFFDLKRYMKPLDRRGCGFPSAWVFVVEPTENVMNYQIIQDEAQTNALIGDITMGMNGNNTWTTPKPVADED